jgi:hypothetical protein
LDPLFDLDELRPTLLPSRRVRKDLKKGEPITWTVTTCAKAGMQPTMMAMLTSMSLDYCIFSLLGLTFIPDSDDSNWMQWNVRAHACYTR